jgi:hypothetical protein
VAETCFSTMMPPMIGPAITPTANAASIIEYLYGQRSTFVFKL